MSTDNAKAAVEAMLVAAAIADDAINDLRAALATLDAKQQEAWRELKAVEHPAVAMGAYYCRYCADRWHGRTAGHFNQGDRAYEDCLHRS